MLDSQKEIIHELGSTVDLLLKSTTLLCNHENILSTRERSLLEQTQESLLSRFVHIEEHLISKGKDTQGILAQKIEELYRLEPALIDKIQENRLRPKIGRNRRKSTHTEFIYCHF